MPEKISELIEKIPGQRQILIVPGLALGSVTSKDGDGVYASSDHLFKGAVFGRDSLEVADDLMETKPKLVRNILLTMVKLQGTMYDESSEEEPGKIIHEYRNVIVDGKPIDDNSMRIFEDLSAKWGGNDKEMAYYGSVDSTPHFLRTLGVYCSLHGDSILNQSVVNRRGEDLTVREAAVSATEWLLGKIALSDSGLVEYHKKNPHGISNQVWKDSEEFYVHENGEIANHNRPISSIEVQGLAYDGLMSAAVMLPEQHARCIDTADQLRDNTINLLWQEDKQYFALGTDYDYGGELRVINTSTANPAALLDTQFFDRLNPRDQQKYISGITKQIMSEDFLTNAGIRSRALSQGGLVDFWDYHGSYVSWPKETFDIAKGFARQGMPKLARQLENRILNIVLKNREYPEFVYVDGHGRVMASSPSSHQHGELMLIDSTNNPERIQAWTVSAVYSIASRRLKQKVKISKKTSQESWQQKLESDILRYIPRMNRYLNPISLTLKYPTHKYALKRNA